MRRSQAVAATADSVPESSIWSRSSRARNVPVLGVIAAGSTLGAVARYGVATWFSDPAGGFGWATLWINVTGCFLIGILMVVTDEVWSAHRLMRPFLGTGVLGGYTTFSTYTVDAQQLLEAGRIGVALAYLAVTLVAALVAVTVAVLGTRRIFRFDGRHCEPVR